MTVSINLVHDAMYWGPYPVVLYIKTYRITNALYTLPSRTSYPDLTAGKT